SRKEPVFFSQKIVRKYYTGHESISNEKLSEDKLQNTIKGFEKILLDNIDLRAISPKNYSKINNILGNLYILNKEKSKGLSCTLKAFTLNPLDLRVFRNLINIILK